MARLARAPQSLTKAVHNMLATTHIQNPQCTYQPTTVTPWVAQPTIQAPTNLLTDTSSKGNLFATVNQWGLQPYIGTNPGNLGLGQGTVIRRTQQPQLNALRNNAINEWHVDLISFTLTHHPNTPEGHANHHAQCTTWHNATLTSKPDECHQYLLTLGMSLADSMECWSGEHRGHQQSTRPGICPGDNLPELEHDWH